MKPDRNVALSGFAGALATLIQFVLAQLGIAMDAGTASALTTVLMFAVAYWVPNPPTSGPAQPGVTVTPGGS